MASHTTTCVMTNRGQGESRTAFKAIWACADNCPVKAQQLREEARQQEAQRRYREEQARHEAFRQSLEHEYGLVGHPKAQKLWNLAWDRGHSQGYDFVKAVYDELSELVL